MDRVTPIPRRVVVTGLSVATALGFELETFWDALLAGRSGIARLPQVPDTSPLPTKYAGHIDDAALAEVVAGFQIDDPDRSNQLALYAVGRALADAGLPTDGQSALEAEMIMGTGHGNSAFHTESARAFFSGGYRKLRPTTVVRLMFNRPAHLASIRYKLTGGTFVVCCACATGSIAFGEAFHKIRFGLAQRAVAACADSGLDEGTFSAWNRLGILSRNPDPERACRPFDRDRDGLVMGEGAAGFVLESLETAQQRGARIHAEVLGYGCTSDAHHIVKPESAGQVRAIRQALAEAGVAPAQVDYVNAHGTATELADLVEAATLREVFGAHADRLPVSNTKAQLGHLMGATAGVELVATLTAMSKSRIPPCRNLEHPDPRCPLNFVRDQPLATPVRIALKNSFAFGGTNSAIVLRQFAG
jgi:3-oxoacyl-(acyl-carrier-protein) synthase